MADRINVTWSLPIIGPFITIIAIRVLWFVAGAPWSEPEGYAFLALFIGGIAGVIAMFSEVKLTIRKWWMK